ncbi:hypothetical protein BU23DRAFT_505564 [Bimuria novae-zelandiae CBS 107.79]|uniref:Uncharacterized protein n=1 Tax=Bimuria novae-zelandiae CBS 107.79 TaxID=1447943 RepID=A0A6A5VL64_9PLEO|nr:hypothetical protein BU23DRAFT_505564 [Bimuria novae-zelandiae CBS 107.79]
MKTTLASAVAFLVATAHSSVVFMVATEPGNNGITYSWVTDRWVCHELTEPGLYKNLSYAYVSSGLANGCALYEDARCNGTSAYIEKYKGDLCCPGAVNLTDVKFDKKAASWACY